MKVLRSDSGIGHEVKEYMGRGSVAVRIAGVSLILLPMLSAHGAALEETSSSKAEEITLSDIVVTARRRSELLQDVPQTITAVTSEELQNYNLQNLKDIAQVVPGLQIVPDSNRSLDSNTFRGVSFHPASGSQNTLGFYINDTFVTNNFVTISNFDIGQIELLNGPQGTLRGEPSPSGSLTITTRKPDMYRFGGYATATATHLGNTNENGAVNLPVLPGKLAVRLAGLVDDDDLDGVKSVNSDRSPYFHTYSGRASVRFTPIDAIEANVMYQHTYWHQNQFTQVEGPGAPGGVNPNAPANYNGPPISASERLGVSTTPTTQWDKQDLITGQLDWHFFGQVLTYDGSYWKYALNNGNSAFDNSVIANQVPGITAANPIPREPFQFYTPSVTQHVQTNELRMSSETALFGFLDYTAGGFFRRTTNEVNVAQLATFFPGAFGSPLAPSDPSIYNSKYTLQLIVNSPAQEKEYSEFLNLTFHMPYDTELAVGGRHIKYDKTGSTQATLLPEGSFVAVPIPAPFCAGVPGGQFGATYPGVCDIPGIVALQGHTTALPFTPQNLSDNTWIYNASLSHKIYEKLLAYVTVGSSWRPPSVSVGINNAANDPILNSLLRLRSEKSTDFEAGVKWTFFEDRGRLNVAYFHQKFKGFIYYGLPTVYLSDTGSGTPTVSTFNFSSNPDAVIDGVNVDAGFRPTRSWSMDLTAAYANGHLTGSEIPCNPPSGDQTAAAFPAGTHVFLCPSSASTSVAPNFNSSLQSEYHVPIPGNSGIEGFARGLYSYYGRNPHASPFYTAPAYGLANFFFGLRSQDGAWEGAVFAKNAFNAKPKLLSSIGNPALGDGSVNAIFGSSGYYTAQVATRQEFGLTFTYGFGSR